MSHFLQGETGGLEFPYTYFSSKLVEYIPHKKLSEVRFGSRRTQAFQFNGRCTGGWR